MAGNYFASGVNLSNSPHVCFWPTTVIAVYRYLWNGSLRLDARELDHLAPLSGFIHQQPPEIRRRTREDRDAQIREPHLDFRISQSRGDLVMEPVNNFGSDALRRTDTVPPAGLVARQVIRDDGQTRQQFRGLHGGYCQSPQLSVTDVLDRRCNIVEHDLYLPGQKVGNRRSRAAIRYMHQIQSCHHLEQFSGHVDRGARARRREIDFPGIGFGIGDEFGHGLDGNRWIYLHDIAEPSDARDWYDVAQEIVVELFIERCVNRIRRRDQKQRVAIGGRPHHHLRADIAASSRPVLDNELLTEALRKPLAYQTSDDVGQATRRIADD